MRAFIPAIILLGTISVLAEVRFAITSDNHFKLSGQPALDCMDIVFGEKPDFIVGLGDQVDQGCDTNEWEMCIKAFRLNDPSGPPVYLVPGNHDYITCNIDFYKKQIADEGTTVREFDERNWRRYYGKYIGEAVAKSHGNTNFYYSVEYENLHISFYYRSGDWFEWLRKDLENSTADWKIAVEHDGVDLITNEPATNALTTLLEEQGVQLHLSGHRHRYYRSVPMTQAKPDPEHGVRYVKIGAALYESNNHPDSNDDWYIDHWGGWASYGIITIAGNTLTLEGMHGDGTGAFDTLVLHHKATP